MNILMSFAIWSFDKQSSLITLGKRASLSDSWGPPSRAAPGMEGSSVTVITHLLLRQSHRVTLICKKKSREWYTAPCFSPGRLFLTMTQAIQAYLLGCRNLRAGSPHHRLHWCSPSSRQRVSKLLWFCTHVGKQFSSIFSPYMSFN